MIINIWINSVDIRSGCFPLCAACPERSVRLAVRNDETGVLRQPLQRQNGRMWQTLLLDRYNPVFAWLPVKTIVAHNQQEYYRIIRRSTTNSDSGIFVAFIL
ncbi:MAG: hypothetical protein LBP85_07390 [Prevotellaceae bacterium]|nr:hypothetical protein [Prevotellaceae bacterium]